MHMSVHLHPTSSLLRLLLWGDFFRTPLSGNQKDFTIYCPSANKNTHAALCSSFLT